LCDFQGKQSLYDGLRTPFFDNLYLRKKNLPVRSSKFCVFYELARIFFQNFAYFKKIARTFFNIFGFLKNLPVHFSEYSVFWKKKLP